MSVFSYQNELVEMHWVLNNIDELVHFYHDNVIDLIIK